MVIQMISGIPADSRCSKGVATSLAYGRLSASGESDERAGAETGSGKKQDISAGVPFALLSRSWHVICPSKIYARLL
jgi:hypothetical protein